MTILIIVPTPPIYCSEVSKAPTWHSMRPLNALNPLNMTRPAIYYYGFEIEKSKSGPLVGDIMHGVVDVAHHDVRNSIRSMIEDEWPCSNPDSNFCVWINNPLHTNDAIKIHLSRWSSKIVTLKSALAIFADVQSWKLDEPTEAGTSDQDEL